MKLYKSKIRKNKILHIVFKKNDFKEMNKESRKDLISPDQFIQLSVLKLKKDQSFRPHFHIWKKGQERSIAQESWVVINGSVKCKFYDLDQQIIVNTLEHGLVDSSKSVRAIIWNSISVISTMITSD